MVSESKINKTSSQGLKSTLKTKWLFLSLFILIMIAGTKCASIKQPTGGPKDSIPPKVLLETPPNLTKRFAVKKIDITFDEFIKLTNQSKEFSISPDMDEAPRFKVKKKTLEITLPDSLAPNTTYTINFGKGLVDYNAGNALINYSYVFATGDKIDSLSISGNVKSAVTKEFEKDVRVLLIPTTQDSIFGKKKANIYTTTDSAGNYKLNNLREGTYRIYALKEQNNDRIYNSAEEEIAFRKDSIVLDKDLSNIDLELFKGGGQKIRVLEKKFEKNGRILMVFNRRLNEPKLEILGDEENNTEKQVRYATNKDTASVYIPNYDIDSIRFKLSEDTTVLDTILIRRGNAKIEPVLEINTIPASGKVDRIAHLKITADVPIKNIDKSKVKLTEDSVARTNYQLARDTTNADLYYIRYNWRKDRKYEIVFTEGAVQGYFEYKNKEKKIDLTYDDTENYGDVTFTFSELDSNSNYLVQLISEKKDRVYRTNKINATNPEVVYKQFPGGKYTLRVILDENKNGIWDTGNVNEKLFPEPVIYLNKVFTIRANWEQRENLSLKDLKPVN